MCIPCYIVFDTFLIAYLLIAAYLNLCCCCPAGAYPPLRGRRVVSIAEEVLSRYEDECVVDVHVVCSHSATM
jgi:hypothetical protein